MHTELPFPPSPQASVYPHVEVEVQQSLPPGTGLRENQTDSATCSARAGPGCFPSLLFPFL